MRSTRRKTLRGFFPIKKERLPPFRQTISAAHAEGETPRSKPLTPAAEIRALLSLADNEECLRFTPLPTVLWPPLQADKSHFPPPEAATGAMGTVTSDILFFRETLMSARKPDLNAPHVAPVRLNFIF